jgi:RimJ/RimL family protein N-acetyltransferase
MTGTTRPIGGPVAPTPAPPPGPVKLAGRYGTVLRLEARRDADSLWQALRGDDGVWTYLAYGPFTAEPQFADWLAGRETLNDPYSYAVLDRGRRAVGIVTLMSIRPDMRVIEVGNILYSPGLQRTPLASETQYLLARYAFESLGYRRYEWKCDSLNAPSRRAAARYGFIFEGLFRQHMIVKGRNRDTAWFSMTDGEWPRRKANFERWLAPENFDSEGRQKVSLAALNGQEA